MGALFSHAPSPTQVRFTPFQLNMTRLAWLLGVALLVGLLGSAHAIIFTLPSSEDVCFGEEVGVRR